MNEIRDALQPVEDRRIAGPRGGRSRACHDQARRALTGCSLGSGNRVHHIPDDIPERPLVGSRHGDAE